MCFGFMQIDVNVLYRTVIIVFLYSGMCCVASFFPAAAICDSVIDTEGFPPSAEDIWILGLAYNLSNGRLQFIVIC